MYLPLNGQATVIDILRGIIIQSGNDASKAIAEHMAGSEEGFAKRMNAVLRIENAEEGGARVTLLLPVSNTDANANGGVQA